MSHLAVLTQRSRVARVVVADDHDLARAGLRSLLSGERGLEGVGEASSGREALELCRRDGRAHAGHERFGGHTRDQA